ncbi:MAG: hypothetical protein ACOCX4_05910 [Planctomycetota bacterium]
MFESLPETARAGLAVYFALLCIVLYFRWRRETRKHESLAYPDASEATWRWAAPPAAADGVTVTQEDTVSRIALSDDPPATQWLALLGGGGCQLLVLYLLGRWIWLGLPEHMAPWGVFIFAGGVALFGLALLRLDAYVYAIERRPDGVTFLIRYAVFASRRIEVPAARFARLAVSGQPQRFFAMQTDQDHVHYRLELKKRRFLARTRRLLLHCQPAEGAWVRDGLQEYARYAAAASPPA